MIKLNVINNLRIKMNDLDYLKLNCILYSTECQVKCHVIVATNKNKILSLN